MNVMIERSSRFRRDFKREYKTHGADLDAILLEVLNLLVSHTQLPAQYEDHRLTGELRGYRSCHIKPDLLLVYEWLNDETLRLARLGSHSELYGV